MEKRHVIIALMALLAMVGSSCSRMTALEKTTDFEYKYEVAKQYFAEGKYSAASLLFADVVTILKGTAYAEESLYILAMSNYCQKDYETAAQYFRKYYQMYPRGLYVEYARYYCGLSLYNLIPDARLDQQSTYDAIKEFQEFLDNYPTTSIKNQTQNMIFQLQDRLVEKEYLAAKLYYDLGSYIMNCQFGGSNWEACVVTAENALHDFPYAEAWRREELSIMILRAKFHLAQQSVESKRLQRYRDCIDEYYAFRNDYPESKYLAEAQSIFTKSDRFVKKYGRNDEYAE